jgi:Co/Zn/Cd efflux system component
VHIGTAHQRKKTYGYRRAGILVALLNSTNLVLISWEFLRSLPAFPVSSGSGISI